MIPKYTIWDYWQIDGVYYTVLEKDGTLLLSVYDSFLDENNNEEDDVQ